MRFNGLSMTANGITPQSDRGGTGSGAQSVLGSDGKPRGSCWEDAGAGGTWNGGGCSLM